MLPSAKVQEKALADALRTSPEFRRWLLGQTRFASLAAEPVLLRSDHPWYACKRTGRQSETDILAVFRDCESALIFALHIENKRKGDRFRPGQPELYQERAKDWLLVPKWGSYSDFQCVLVATEDFIRRYWSDSAKFDVIVTAEAVARFLPEFRDGMGLDPVETNGMSSCPTE